MTERVQNVPSTSADSTLYLEANDDSDDDGQLLVRTLSIPRSNQSKAAQQFLARMDADIVRIVSSTNSRKESLDEVTSTLTRQQIQPLSKSGMVGADCGVNWWSMVVLMFCIGLLVPCVVFLYYEYFQHYDDDGTLSSSSSVYVTPRHTSS